MSPVLSKLFSKMDLLVVISFFLMTFLFILAVIAPWLAPYDPGKLFVGPLLNPPFLFGGDIQFAFGTDDMGKDILSNILYGLRLSLFISIFSGILALVMGGLIGILSGYFGGTADMIIMRIVDIQLSLPALLIALFLMVIFGSSLLNVILVLFITRWARFARVARGVTLNLKEKEFIESAIALGCNSFRVIFRHILPCTINPVLVVGTVEIPRLIIMESTLTYLGVGIPIGVPSLGNLIYVGYRVIFSGQWWVSTIPGFVLLIIVFSMNIIGDWFRDFTDPYLKHIK